MTGLGALATHVDQSLIAGALCIPVLYGDRFPGFLQGFMEKEAHRALSDASFLCQKCDGHVGDYAMNYKLIHPRVQRAKRYHATGTTIFDIGGNKYRLVARVDFAEQLLLIQRILTHEDYSREIF